MINLLVDMSNLFFERLDKMLVILDRIATALEKK